ncbi:MAG: LysR family transcriptional regulator [Sulfuritalea sp.]|nr:LysR family transcriptional regulator [Sulfuritalea sp.]
MDRLAAMQTFVRVAEAGSFTAVADQMNVARSAVTRQIAALEAHLGVKLIAHAATSSTASTKQRAVSTARGKRCAAQFAPACR